MGGISFLLITIALGLLERGDTYGARVADRYPIGTVGCLFTRHLCDLDEECVDDLLFGNCQRVSSPKDFFQYQLTGEELSSLEKHIWHLIKGDYSWQDPYSQCVLQNALLAFRRGETFDRNFCKRDTGDYTENVSSEVSNVLEKIFREYSNYYAPRNSAENSPTSESKRDEIIQVHKYFDQEPAGHHKRLYGDLERGQSDLNYLKDLSPLYPDLTGSDITMDDVKVLQYYLNQLNDDPENLDRETSDYTREKLLSKFNNYDDRLLHNDEASNLDLGSYVSWKEGAGNPSSYDEGLDNPVGNEAEEAEGVADYTPTLPPQYANLLDKLIAGEIKPENLTTEEVTYLTDYVNARLLQSGYTPAEIDELIGVDNSEGKDDEGPISGKGAPTEGADVMSLPTSQQEARNDVNDEESLKKKTVGFPVVGDIEEPESKKSLDLPQPRPRESEKPAAEKVHKDDNKLIADHYYVIVDKDMSPYNAGQLIKMISNAIGYNIKNANESADHKKLIFEVFPYQLRGQNSSIVDTINGLKQSVKSDLKLTIEDVGVGYGDLEVGTKKKDDRYFVLSFVLCGLIAGILLAAVSVYLIRRHTRSKQKLAQLSSGSAPGTEPSKDYQDLCRQRMQSKSSEKPEPLHAASRIGSVSEQQVRSPSSRSSTSSWSEEPAATNMDISTGHIVLSYMEDHLKNKDRLEREWEALCSYEADPSSTNVASDSANMRKNRYSDTLPYDHSRVILSNTSNASGSDYINASTITDHDPRNPAYIATQGPLPHTVADFWQMVWEQGSVVLVTLTKLTENGEAMCHRYWPEEGSDLYHIYEVHLVSEHIWCDDYLVRSFYLKNLQTSETRTVTQFHFLTWPDLGIPSSIKALLDFRRKVNKSYRGRSCPIVVHCSDGCGRTGTYCLLDMVLNRMSKGAKEIDIAATLEHIRDQRMKMVKTKEQFQFSLAAVAEEVHAILKALPQ